MKLVLSLLAASIVPLTAEAATVVPEGKSKFRVEAGGDCFDSEGDYYACYGGGPGAEFIFPANVKVLSAYVGVKSYKGPRGFWTDDDSLFYFGDDSSHFYGLFYLPNDKNFKWIEPLFSLSRYNADTSAGGYLEYYMFGNVSENPGEYEMTYEFRFELERTTPALYPQLRRHLWP